MDPTDEPPSAFGIMVTVYDSLPRLTKVVLSDDSAARPSDQQPPSTGELAFFLNQTKSQNKNKKPYILFA